MAARAQFDGFTGPVSNPSIQEMPKKEGGSLIKKTELVVQKSIPAQPLDQSTKVLSTKVLSISPNPIILKPKAEKTHPETMQSETEAAQQLPSLVPSLASDEEVEKLQQQELERVSYQDLHKSITQSKYDAVTSQYSGCLAKVYKVFRSIMYAIFGTRGYGLGTAKDDRVHVKTENKAIRKYETAIKTLVDYIQHNKPNTSNTATFTSIMNNFHDTVLYRMMQIAVLYPSRNVSICYNIALKDIHTAIAKCNQSNLEAIDKTWEEIIRDNLIERNSNKGLISTAAASLTTCFAPKVTPAFIKENGLKSIGDYANSYVSLFGTSQLEDSLTTKNAKKEVVLTLRKEVYKLYKDKTIDMADFTYFTLSELDETQEKAFLSAVFQNDIGSSDNPANEWCIRQ